MLSKLGQYYPVYFKKRLIDSWVVPFIKLIWRKESRSNESKIGGFIYVLLLFISQIKLALWDLKAIINFDIISLYWKSTIFMLFNPFYQKFLIS
ncbi:unnamed protein product [Blepharisma stoltei]|uniref:Uncharacterized protein n=1 Tax=Blepharisma stoltei TaxID=1481888 RepID=A0AAU9IND4_9CILI|nr:unnamed protein product [Blepharisma stoltei]